MLRQALDEHREVLDASIDALEAPFERALLALREALGRGSTVLVLGNGGSASQSLHFAAELTGRFERDRPALPAVALVADVAALTAVANDYGFERVFSRQVEALGRPGDLVVAISTSGRSANVIAALEAARAKGLLTIGLTGRSGGLFEGLVDHHLAVPSDRTPRVQEIHSILLHALAEGLEPAVGST